MKSIRTILSTALVAGLAIVIASFASFASSEFEGVWAVKNTKGEPFEITLAGDGTATSTLPEADKGNLERRGQRRGDQLGFRLDYQDRQRGRQVRQDGLQEGCPA